VSKGRSLIIKVSLRDIVFKSLSTILHARYYRWATSCIWRGFLYLSGITRIRRHEGERSTGWPRFHYIITFLVLGHALFPCLGVSSLVLFRLANRNISINRPKLDSRERECGFILIGFLLTTRASRVTQNRPSCFFVLSGCAGRARNEGRKRRSGIACKSYALSSIYPPFESDPFNVRIASLCSCLSSNVSQDLPSIILRQSCPSSNNNFLWFRGRIVRGALDKYFTEIDFSLYTFKVDLYGNRIPWQIMLQMNSWLQSLFRNAQRKGEILAGYFFANSNQTLWFRSIADLFQSLFHVTRDFSSPVIVAQSRTEIESCPRYGRQVNSLTRLHLTVVVTKRHANESICVCPQGTDGIPGAEVQLAFDYRSSSSATATQSDTVWPARGNDDTFRLIYPGDCLETKRKRKKEKKSKRALSFCLLRPISKRTEQRLAPFSLFRSESSLTNFFFFFLYIQLHIKSHAQIIFSI